MSTTENECGCPGYGLSRRRFLGLTGAVLGAGAIATSTNGVFRQVALAAEGLLSDNVLVVLSLRGGADGLSMLVPYGDPAYYAARPRIAVPKSQLLVPDGFFGLHPAMSPLVPMWKAGRLTAVHAVGTPLPNRSHFAAMEEIEDADPGSAARTGWLNRLIGIDSDRSPFQGVNVGSKMVPTALMGPEPVLGFGRPEELRLPGARPPHPQAAWKRRALQEGWSGRPGALGAAARSALDVTANLPAGLADPPPTSGRYPAGALGDSLSDTARLIRAQVGARVIALDYGNWDMHTDLGTLTTGTMLLRLTELAQGLAAFFDDLGTLSERVTVVTVSEFGRRVAENGSGGVDHGYGNVVFVAGGGVRGGRVHAQWPGLAHGALVDGDLAVTRDYRSVLAEVVRARFPVDVSQVFPRFQPEAPLGLMTG